MTNNGDFPFQEPLIRENPCGVRRKELVSFVFREQPAAKPLITKRDDFRIQMRPTREEFCHGLHVIIRGKVPTPLKRDQIEMYCMERFFTMSGHVVGAGRD